METPARGRSRAAGGLLPGVALAVALLLSRATPTARAGYADDAWLDAARLAAPTALDAAARDEAAAWAHYLTALQLAEEGQDPEAASAQLAAAIHLRPTDETLIVAYVSPWILDPDDLYRRVRRDLEATASAHPEAAALACVVAEACVHQGDLARAQRLLERAARATDAADTAVVLALLRLYGAQDRPLAAHRLLERAKAPTRCGPDWRFRDAAARFYIRCVAARTAGDGPTPPFGYDRRFRALRLEHALAAAALVQPAGYALDRAQALAAWLADQGHADAAIAALDRANRDAAGSAASLAQLARLYTADGQTDAALSVWDRLALQHPVEPTFLIEKARLLAAAGRSAEAMDAYADSLRLQPQAPALVELASLYLSAGKPKPARQLSTRLPVSYPDRYRLGAEADLLAGDPAAALAGMLDGDAAVRAAAAADRLDAAFYGTLARAAEAADRPLLQGVALDQARRAADADAQAQLRLALWLVDHDRRPATAAALARPLAHGAADPVQRADATLVLAWICHRRGRHLQSRWLLWRLREADLSPAYRPWLDRLHGHTPPADSAAPPPAPPADSPELAHSRPQAWAPAARAPARRGF